MSKFKTLFFSIIIGLAVAIVVFAWTNPSDTPPGGNGALSYSNGNVGIGTSTPSTKLYVYGTMGISNSTKVANLNADLLDGYDSSILGDATAANQVTIINKIGTSTDAAAMNTTLFAGQQAIYDRVDNSYSSAYVAGGYYYWSQYYPAACMPDACLSGWTDIGDAYCGFPYARIPWDGYYLWAQCSCNICALAR